MSRAFVSEKGDWDYCREKQDTCIYADGKGKCIFSSCRKDQEKQETAAQSKGVESRN
ncbi:MAG: hypothetical protein FWF85_04930 [Clostridiales bacterium]|nr:hypothetical protein [Clostridiales bacterium]